VSLNLAYLVPVLMESHRHTAAPPTVYGTVMNYVALRLSGMGPDEGPMTEIRGLIYKMGGCGCWGMLANIDPWYRRGCRDTNLGEGLVEYTGGL
jgi:hypothetical protein